MGKTIRIILVISSWFIWMEAGDIENKSKLDMCPVNPGLTLF